MGQLFTNNATAILQGNISALDTQLTVTASLADLFKVATTSNWGVPLDWYKVTIEDNLGNTEIVKVGIRTLGSGILSNLLRGQDGTIARNWNAGANVAARFTAQDLVATVGGVEANTAAIAATQANLAGTGTGQGGNAVGYFGQLNSEQGKVSGRLGVDIYVTDAQFGAAVNGGAGGADSSAALQAAVAFANSLCISTGDAISISHRPRLIFPPGLGFKSSVGLVIDTGIDVVMQSPLYIAGATGAPIVGITYKNNRPSLSAHRDAQSIFDVRRITQSNWSSESDIGILIEAGYNGNIFVKRVDNFCIGLDACQGYGKFRLGDIRNTKGIIFSGRGAPDNFTNDFECIGGNFSVGGGVNNGISRWGIKLIGAAPFGFNTSRFSGQGYELNNAGALIGNPAATSFPVIIDGTALPVTTAIFTEQRMEVCGRVFASLLGDVRGCEFGILDSELEFINPTSLQLSDQSTRSGGNVLYKHTGPTAPGLEQLFTTGRFVDNTVAYTGSLRSVRNMEVAVNVGASPAQQTFTHTANTIAFDAAGYCTSGGNLIGIRVKLNGARQFTLRGRKLVGASAAGTLLLFDAAGVQINAPNKAFIEQSALVPNLGVYGGKYDYTVYPATAPQNAAPLFGGNFGFAPDVATVFVCVTSSVDEWAIYTHDDRPSWFSSTSHMRNEFVATNIPVALANVVYRTGMRVSHFAPALGVTTGWRCTDGSVPTFRAEANLL